MSDSFLSNYAIGTTVENLTNLAALATKVRYPKSSYQPATIYQNLGSGLVRAGGWRTPVWAFAGLTRAERDMLRTFCTGASSKVYITTRVNDNVSSVGDAWKTFYAVMLWPQGNENKDFGGFRSEFMLQFRVLSEVTP